MHRQLALAAPGNIRAARQTVRVVDFLEGEYAEEALWRALMSHGKGPEILKTRGLRSQGGGRRPKSMENRPTYRKIPERAGESQPSIGVPPTFAMKLPALRRNHDGRSGNLEGIRVWPMMHFTWTLSRFGDRR
jgi:hypothetical protein